MLFGIENQFNFNASNFFKFQNTTQLNSVKINQIVSYLNKFSKNNIQHGLPSNIKHNTVLESI
jgi:uncharacterized membrane protein required for colicin V production